MTRPQVELLIAPKATGKRREMMRRIREEVKAHPADTIVLAGLNAEAARRLQSFMSVRPMGKTKAALLDLDGASPEAVNALLKLLEEPPPFAYFAMYASADPLLTILSRAHVERRGLLTKDQVYEQLTATGMSPDAARAEAERSSGTLGGTDVPEGVRPGVLAMLKAIADEDDDLASNASQTWTQDHTDLLRAWTREVLTGRHRHFAADETLGLDRTDAALLARILDTPARPRLLARSAYYRATNARRKRSGR